MEFHISEIFYVGLIKTDKDLSTVQSKCTVCSQPELFSFEYLCPDVGFRDISKIFMLV